MILVTGGTGMLGAQLLVKLTARGDKVRALKRPSSDMALVKKTFGWYSTEAEKHFNQIEWFEGDLLDTSIFDDLLKGVEQVFHCAALVSFDPADQQKLMRINVTGTANLVDALIEIPGAYLCHVSSIAAIGAQEDGRAADETTAWKYDAGTSNYSLSKYNSEREVWRGMAEGLNVVIVNPSVILGPGDWHSGSSALFSLAHKGMPFFTNGTTGYVDVRDVAEVMMQLADMKVVGERFIVSAGNMSYRDFFTIAAIALQSKPPRYKISPWMGELAWRFYTLKGWLTGTKPSITRETARNAQKVRSYTSAKLIALTGFKFIPLEESIRHYALLYLSEHQGT
jgi:nucleoside-diphosphate-sugar epimerase